MTDRSCANCGAAFRRRPSALLKPGHGQFCSKACHFAAKKAQRTHLERFEEKFLRCPVSGCWLWTDHTNKRGYGRFWDGERKLLAHRWSYQHHIGPILDGLELDHKCNTPACVNPAHLEPVTHRENMLRGLRNPTGANARKTHCKNGHKLSGDNVIWSKGGGRRCKICTRAIDRERSASSRNGARTRRPPGYVPREDLARRRAYCKRGHALYGRNVLNLKYGRRCRQCHNLLRRKKKEMGT
jgi:hypothetical protein